MHSHRDSPPPSPLLGTVLVTGGCGFFGYHLVGRLLEDPECGGVHVLDRNTSHNRHAAATYAEGSVTDVAAVTALLARVRPRVIFHCASPPAAHSVARDFTATNVTGTQILLSAANAANQPASADSGDDGDVVRAFVFTSSIDVYADPPHFNGDETMPLWPASARISAYNATKALADAIVRQAGGQGHLRTVVLRPGHMYGERHAQGMAEVLDLAAGGRPLVQIGDGTNLVEVASAENVAVGHILAAKALIDPTRAKGSVDGEAFNVSDGAPVPFWHHVKVIYGVARGEQALKRLVVLPGWIMVLVVTLVEWVLWLFTLDMIQPPMTFSRTSLSYCLETHTHSIQKARDTLGFEPVVNHDEVLAQSVRWELERRANGKVGEQLKKTE